MTYIACINLYPNEVLDCFRLITMETCDRELSIECVPFETSFIPTAAKRCGLMRWNVVTILWCPKTRRDFSTSTSVVGLYYESGE